MIDDDEDASGEGLMQRIGVDGPDEAASGTRENELLGDTARRRSRERFSD